MAAASDELLNLVLLKKDKGGPDVIDSDYNEPKDLKLIKKRTSLRNLF